MDEHMKFLAGRLGHAISSALSESAEIADIIDEIRQAGYIPVLTFETRIGLIPKEEGTDKEFSGKEGVHITSADKDFLRKMKISLEDPEDP